MKRMKKWAMVCVMLIALGVSAVSAAGLTTEPEKTKVVVTKLAMESLVGFPKGEGKDEYDGTAIADMQAYFGTHTTLKGVAFKVTRTDVTPNEVVKNGESDFWITGEGGVINVELPKGTYLFEEIKEASTYIGDNGEILTDAAAVPFTLTLPMIMEDGTYFDNADNPLYVYPKNTLEAPTVTKEKANESTKDTQVGDVVPYVVTTTVPAESNYKKVAWSDRMSIGLKMNNDVTLKTTPDLNLTLDVDYTLTYGDNGFVLNLTEAGLKKLKEKSVSTTDPAYTGVETVFVLEYSATVTKEAIADHPLQNTVSFHYGNKEGYSVEPGDNNPPPVTPTEGNIPFNKTWATGGGNPPDGASVVFQLYVYNRDTNLFEEVTGKAITVDANTGWAGEFTGLDNEKTYKVVEKAFNHFVPNYTLNADGSVTIKNKPNDNPPPNTPPEVIVVTGGKQFIKTGEDDARLIGAKFILSDKISEGPIKYLVKDQTTGAVSWTETKEEATIFTSDEKGWFDMVGLEYTVTKDADGVDVIHKYQLIETEAPKGYAKLTTPIDVVIDAGSYTNGTIGLDPDKADPALVAQEIKNKKVVIPQTGGIGTAIFIAAGMAIMGVAAFGMNRSSEEKE